MLKNPDFITARGLLLDAVTAVETQQIPLESCAGRVLAENVAAAEHVPPFDRSPYDGYALRSEDTACASREEPAVLYIVEEVPAGAVPTKACTRNTAVKILTGAPIPEGADCVINYERTEFTESAVRIFEPLKAGSNIVRMGEDVRRGDILARAGQVIDAGTAGTLAAQGIACPTVFRRPRVGILSTGNEVAEPGAPLPAGKIYNSNRFTLAAEVERLGCEPVYLGLAGDSPAAVCDRLRAGLEQCDAVISTGGVSVGDYDFTPAAMEMARVELLFRGVKLKPGMACACGVKDGKLVCGLSGNPASALTNFCAVVAPTLKKLAGRSDFMPREVMVTLRDRFGKKSPGTRLLRGTLDLSDGTAGMRLSGDQGNVVISSAIGCDVMAVVPAGSGPVEAGTVLEGFLL